jgi:peptidoglycan hydrolase-like protein with peptidoglycan-binding domain
MSMKRIILATVAATALCVPALAQQNTGQGAQSVGQQQTQNTGHQMSAQQLNDNQMRELQQALNDKGFSPGSVDGKWGPNTRKALEDFQKSQKMRASENLDANMIAALGLNGSDFGINGNPETTGQAPRSQSSPNNNGNAPQSNAPQSNTQH